MTEPLSNVESITKRRVLKEWRRDFQNLEGYDIKNITGGDIQFIKPTKIFRTARDPNNPRYGLEFSLLFKMGGPNAANEFISSNYIGLPIELNSVINTYLQHNRLKVTIRLDVRPPYPFHPVRARLVGLQTDSIAVNSPVFNKLVKYFKNTLKKNSDICEWTPLWGIWHIILGIIAEYSDISKIQKIIEN